MSQEDPIAVLKQFVQGAIDALYENQSTNDTHKQVRVTENRRPMAIDGHPGFDQVTGYEFTFRGRGVLVDVHQPGVFIDGVPLAGDVVDEELFDRLRAACAEWHVFQSVNDGYAVERRTQSQRRAARLEQYRKLADILGKK